MQPPLLRADVEAEGGLDLLDIADGSVANELDGGEVGGFEVAAVGDHELDVGGLAGGDHGFGFGDADAHGFFAEDVLAGFGGAEGVFGVHGVGQGDVDGIDFVIVSKAVHILVVVDIGFGDAVLGGDAGGFVGMAGDERGDFGVAGGLDGAHEVVGDAAEADDGVADFAAGGLCAQLGCEVCREGHGAELGELAAGNAHEADSLFRPGNCGGKSSIRCAAT